MTSRKRWALAVLPAFGAGLLVTALVAGALTGPPGEEAPARPLPNEQAAEADDEEEARLATEDEALERDAAGYAEAFDVPLDEAIQRGRWQMESGPTVEALAEAAPERFAGAWIEHEPSWRVVVRFTGGSEGLDAVYEIARQAPIPVEVRTGASHTWEQLLAILPEAIASLDPDSHAGGGLGVGPTIIIYVLEDSQYAEDPEALEAQFESSFGAPFDVQVIPEGPTPALSIPQV